MSLRDSRVLSAYINNEFDFLSDEMNTNSPYDETISDTMETVQIETPIIDERKKNLDIRTSGIIDESDASERISDEGICDVSETAEHKADTELTPHLPNAGVNPDLSSAISSPDLFNSGAIPDVSNAKLCLDLPNAEVNPDRCNTEANPKMSNAEENSDLPNAGVNSDLSITISSPYLFNSGVVPDVSNAKLCLDLPNAEVNPNMCDTEANPKMSNAEGNADLPDAGVNPDLSNSISSPDLVNTGAGPDGSSAKTSSDRSTGEVNSDLFNTMTPLDLCNVEIVSHLSNTQGSRNSSDVEASEALSNAEVSSNQSNTEENHNTSRTLASSDLSSTEETSDSSIKEASAEQLDMEGKPILSNTEKNVDLFNGSGMTPHPESFVANSEQSSSKVNPVVSLVNLESEGAGSRSTMRNEGECYSADGDLKQTEQNIPGIEDLAKCVLGNGERVSSSPPASAEKKPVKDLIYAESFRNSRWIFVKEEESECSEEESDPNSDTSDGENGKDSASPVTDDNMVSSSTHGDSVSTTNDSELVPTAKDNESVLKPSDGESKSADVDDSASTAELVISADSQSVDPQTGFSPYRRSYKELSIKRVQRQASQQTFARVNTSEVSAEKEVTLTKAQNGESFGIHINGDHPTTISHVVPGSAAERAKIEVGDVILAVDYKSVLHLNRDGIVALLLNIEKSVTLELCRESSFTLMSNERNNVDDQLYAAQMYKLVNVPFNIWKKRWFILKSDNCLYYYKDKEDKEILGAIPLAGYMVQRAIDLKRPKDFSLKLMHPTKTYYFAAPTEDELTKWAQLLNEATKSQSTMDSWIDVSSHNVGLPALSIRNIDCNGFLHKMGGHYKSWKKRYCILKDGCLFYYYDIDSRSAQGVAHLHGYTTHPNPISSKKNAFDLVPPEPRMRTFHFFAETEFDKERWIRRMTLSIGRWVQVT